MSDDEILLNTYKLLIEDARKRGDKHAILGAEGALLHKARQPSCINSDEWKAAVDEIYGIKKN